MLRIGSGVSRLIANHPTSPSSKARQKSGPFAPPALPGFDAPTTPSDSRRRPPPDVTLRLVPRLRRVSLVARTTMRTCRAHYPGGSKRVHVSVAPPFHAAFPETLGGSASALSFSRPAQASLAIRPARSLNEGLLGVDEPARPTPAQLCFSPTVAAFDSGKKSVVNLPIPDNAARQAVNTLAATPISSIGRYLPGSPCGGGGGHAASGNGADQRISLPGYSPVHLA
jgi:hypothetical protein